jgi:hypothetical protein
MNGKDGRIMIILPGKHRGEGALLQLGFDRRGLDFQFGAQAFIVKLGKLERVTDVTRKTTPGINFRFDGVVLLHHLLCLGGVAPKIGTLDFFLELGKL